MKLRGTTFTPCMLLFVAAAGCDDVASLPAAGHSGHDDSGSSGGASASASATATSSANTGGSGGASSQGSTGGGATGGGASSGSGGDGGGGGQGGRATCDLPDPGPTDCEAPETFDGYVRHVCNVPKGKLAGDNLVDVYQPNGAQMAPTIFYVHGGGFIGGTRRDSVPLLARYASLGYVVVSIDYTVRPSNALSVPTDMIETVDEMDFEFDAAAAFAWTRAHLGTFGGDPENIVFMGHSAGGAIVSLLASKREWIRDALEQKSLICPDDVARFETSDVIRGVVNLSGPVDFTLWTYAWAQPLFQQGFSPAMRVEASPITWLAQQASVPPFLFVVGGGNGFFNDPPGLAQGHGAFAAMARGFGMSATIIQPLITKKASGLGWPNEALNGKWCFAHMNHLGGPDGLANPSLPIGFDQIYDEDVYGVCNQLAFAGQSGEQAVAQAAADAFVADPTAAIPWADGPSFSHLSVPDQDPSPLLLHIGGGPVPSPSGLAWTGIPPAPGSFDGARDLIGEPIDPSGVTTSAGDPVPRAVLAAQAIAPGGGLTMSASSPVPNGLYEIRAYFTDGNPNRKMDITAEGALIGDDVAPFGGVPLQAKVVVLGTVEVTDGSIDLVFTSPQSPRIAAIELVPVP